MNNIDILIKIFNSLYPFFVPQAYFLPLIFQVLAKHSDFSFNSTSNCYQESSIAAFKLDCYVHFTNVALLSCQVLPTCSNLSNQSYQDHLLVFLHFLSSQGSFMNSKGFLQTEELIPNHTHSQTRNLLLQIFLLKFFVKMSSQVYLHI